MIKRIGYQPLNKCMSAIGQKYQKLLGIYNNEPCRGELIMKKHIKDYQ